VREEVPKRSRPRYVVTRLVITETVSEDGVIYNQDTTHFYIVDLHDKARCIWKVTARGRSGSGYNQAKSRASQIAAQMNSSYERGLRAATNGS
jgi:hypothetical protein